jgi:ABC-2 type transport system ATP-binding protein
MTAIVEVNALTKQYGSSPPAVNNVSFVIEEGKIYGLLGRNGAGKTTLMHMLTAQLFATEGSLKVFGESPVENNRVLSRMAFIKESQAYPDSYRVSDALEVAALYYPNWDHAYALSLMKDFRLPLKKKIKKLSRGMLSAVGIILGLASRAPLTLFDEPYLGLDAAARSLFYNRLLEDYAEHPRTVILSTHLIDEVSQLLEHVLIIDNGRIILDEEAEALRGRAFSVAGLGAKVETFTSGRQVISRNTLGGLVSVTVMGGLDAAERKKAEALGLELTPVSLQQLVVYLTTEPDDGRKAGAAL